MAYTPTNWKDGDKITAEKLNKLEQGVADIQAAPGGDSIDLSAYAPKANPVFSGSISMGRKADTEVGENSISLGDRSEASEIDTIALGSSSKATRISAVAIGCNCSASGNSSLAAGRNATAIGDSSVSLGGTARGASAFVGPMGNAIGDFSFAFGYNANAGGAHQTVLGRNNVTSTAESDKLIIGSGYYDEEVGDEIYQNCFRVTHTGVYASGAYNSSGADYAELFEWADGDPAAEDRAGRFVTLDGEKIRLAGPEDDYILGIVSAAPSVVGDVYDDQWAGMYLLDVFGRPVWEEVEVPERTLDVPDPEDPEKTITRTIVPAHTERRQKRAPDYDPGQPYIPRTQRPEWAAVGLLGKLVAVDDGTCEVNGWAAAGENGTARASAERTRFRVMARLDDTHIRVMIL